MPRSRRFRTASGRRPPEALGSLHGEVLRLGRMVDDLHQLALSDLGALTCRKERLDLAAAVPDRDCIQSVYGAGYRFEPNP